MAATLASGVEALPSMVDEVKFIHQHNHKFYSYFEIEEASSDENKCVFRLAGKRKPDQVLLIEVTREAAYAVLAEEGLMDGKMAGRTFESFEQIMSSLDEGDYGDLLCGLAAEKLGLEEAVQSENQAIPEGGWEEAPLTDPFEDGLAIEDSDDEKLANLMPAGGMLMKGERAR